MDILILGGTQFVGRHITQAVLNAGHSATIFSRGQTNAELFPDVPRLIGDRNDDLSAIETAVQERKSSGQSFDACIDVSCYTRNQILRSLAAVGSSVGRYLLISSISVYKPPVVAGFGEDSAVEQLTDPDVEMTGETYGGLKVVCENEVESAIGDRSVAFRLGLVNGPWDHTDRATYWAMRAREGGKIFVPAGPERPFQIIDPRDIGLAAVFALSNELSGAFNIVNQPTTWGNWLNLGASTAGQPATPEYVFADDAAWVADQVESLTDSRPIGPMPMFLPPAYGWTFWQASNQRSLASGITYRDVAETVRDTVAWRAKETGPLKAGLEPEQERQLLHAWENR